MFLNNSTRSCIQLTDRCFTDNPNLNNLYYRESEVHVRVNHDKEHLRDNAGPAAFIYTTVHHPLCYCEEHQQKTYNAE